MNFSEEDILRLQPFKSQIGNINAVESLKGPCAISGNSFKITAAGIKYKLRCCDNAAVAGQIKDNISKLPKYFPKFIGWEGQFVLFEWIDGNILENHTVADCYFIGKMIGEAHELGLVAENANPHSFFNSRIETLSTVFSEEQINQIIKKYSKLTEKLKLDVVLEFSDVHQSNFIKDKKGDIYYVDEEGFGYKIKGLGISKPLFTQEWIKTKEEKEAFWKGYNEHHSSDYFDMDYQRFICFVQLLRTIAVRVKSGANYSREVSEVLEFLKE